MTTCLWRSLQRVRRQWLTQKCFPASLCVSHRVFSFLKFSFFSCPFLPHTALFCCLIHSVSLKSKHLAGSDRDLVLKMPFDLGLCKAAPEKSAVHPQPCALSWGSRNSFWGNQLILGCIAKLASLRLSSIPSFSPFHPDFFSLLLLPPLFPPSSLAFIFSRRSISISQFLLSSSLSFSFICFCCFLSSSPSSQWFSFIFSLLELSFQERGARL